MELDDANFVDENEFPLEGSTWTFFPQKRGRPGEDAAMDLDKKGYGKGPFVARKSEPKTIRAGTIYAREIVSLSMYYWENSDGSPYYPPKGTNRWPPVKT